ncbi:biotin synthase BioB [Salinibacter altiplanensis]|uniref:biotin synthase BioB n=1 Tax=Salinibacter altiplanensis TaxID=1803181 RepID=UPI000C9F7353|nr:biotin synthase BioB [Salinibacter altiplanensis]
MTDWTALATQALEGPPLSSSQALRVVHADDDEVLALLDAAFRVRRHHHGRRVRIHVLQNAKSGVCPEDCAFCSQSLKFDSEPAQYGMQRVDTIVEGAEEAWDKGAVTYCIVTATRGPHSSEVDVVCEATRRIKEKYPMDVCASLGLLDAEQAQQLAEAGVDRYNHNLETSSSHFENVVSTHEWIDRVETVNRAKAAGMEACCGGIIGLGESREDWVDLAMALREIGVESVPVNFLHPRSGTPLEDVEKVRPQECLKALAMFRLVHPEADIRMAGGREVVLDQMQPLALYAANSFFTDGYLTTGGQGESEDYQMIQQAGFEPVIVEDGPERQGPTGPDDTSSEHSDVASRTRQPSTDPTD